MSHPAQVPATRVDAPPRPGWVEIVVGMAVFALVAYGTASLLPAGMGPVARGLALAALSGVAGIAGFAVAAAVRVRSLGAFGVRATSLRWVLIGVGGGVLAFLFTRLMGVVLYAIGVQPENVQETYSDAGGGGLWSIAASILFLAVLTPLGEELAFRGVVTTALLRYGAFVGVTGSAVVFALMHGFNFVLVTALFVGLVTAELRRRSGSVWPGVAVHIVNNTLAQVLGLVVAGSL